MILNAALLARVIGWCNLVSGPFRSIFRVSEQNYGIWVLDSSARVIRRLAVGWEGVGGPTGGAPARLVGTTPRRQTPAPCWGERCLRP